MNTKEKTETKKENKPVTQQYLEHIQIIKLCIKDAKNILKDEKMMDIQSHTLSIAMTLFKERANNIKEQKQTEKKTK